MNIFFHLLRLCHDQIQSGDDKRVTLCNVVFYVKRLLLKPNVIKDQSKLNLSQAAPHREKYFWHLGETGGKVITHSFGLERGARH